MCKSFLLLICAGLLLCPLLGRARAGGNGPGTMTPTQLRCEFRVDPLGVDSPQPRLEWTMHPRDRAARGQKQTAYQVLAASSPALLSKAHGDLWDSGRVASDRMNQIAYRGKPLRSSQGVWWTVRVWDQAGKTSPWSVPASWTMGLLRPADWAGARWVGAPDSLKGDDNSTILLRREFEVKRGLKRALVHVCGLGQYEMTVNGRAATPDWLTPGWTQYKKTCLYDTDDITALVHAGQNAVGLLLSNGMYRVGAGRYHKFLGSFGPLQAIALIRLEYRDGTSENVVTDGQWQAGASPMTFSNIYGGEDWDARKVETGWDGPGFDGSKWSSVQVLSGPGGALAGLSHAAPPIRTFEVHQPISRKEIKPNVTVYDLGQTASHIARFTVHGPAGSMIRITPDELLLPDGSLFRNNYNGKAWSQYILAGSGSENYTAKFYYGGNRYYQVECLPAPGGMEVPHVDAIEGVVVHSNSDPVGEFSCSNDLFNRIYAMIRWAERSNMMSVISDCPHRERLGWLEQDHLHGPSFRDNFDMRPLVTKIISDMSDSQDPDGLIPTTAPEYMIMSKNWRDAIEWGSSGILLPWQQYRWTGDLDVLRRNYPMMKRYMAYLTGQAKNGIAAPGLGDWTGQHASPDTPKPLVATALYYQNARLLAQSARLLGDTAQSASQERLAASIRDAFNTAFFHPDTHQYGSGSQCANALALDLGLAAPADRQAVLDNLVADLEARHYELTVGEVGLEYLFRALAEGGRSDVIYAMNNQSDRPGYGYQLKMGATALCETWNAARDNSQDQFMLGHIMEWFYHDLAGIQLDPDTPGFKHSVIRPAIVGALTEARAGYTSIQGRIISGWKRSDGRVTLDVTIPPNTTATVYIPTRGAGAITESGHPAAQSPGVTVLRSEPGYAVCAVLSGTYSFSAPFSGKSGSQPLTALPGAGWRAAPSAAPSSASARLPLPSGKSAPAASLPAR